MWGPKYPDLELWPSGDLAFMRFDEIEMIARIRLIALCAVQLLMCGEAAKRIFCLTDASEPTLLEVLTAAVPSSASSAAISAEILQFANGTSHDSIVQSVLGFRLPLMSIFSSGQYFVTFPEGSGQKTEDFSFNDVSLLEESYAFFNLPCHMMVWSGVPWVRDWCSCSAAQAVKPADWASLPAALSPYCLAPQPCTGADYKRRSCRIPVDPFRRACVVIETTTQMPSLNRDLQQQQQQQIVSFNLSTLSLLDVLPLGPVPGMEPVRRLLSLPVHLLCLGLGLLITLHAQDLADMRTVQVLVEAAFGLGLAVLLLAFVLYRPIERLLSRYGGVVAGAFFPYSLLTTLCSLLYRHPALLRQLLSLLTAFWEDGFFGLPWLGKAFFLSFVLLSVSICQAFGWFHEDSESRIRPCMLWAVRAVGLGLLAQGSASRDISVLLVCAGLVLPAVLPYWDLGLLVLEARRQSWTEGRSLARPARGSKAAVQLTSRATKAALDSLREHLRAQPADLHRCTDSLQAAGDKRLEAALLMRFAEGSYTGVPRVTEDDDESAAGGWRTSYGVLLAVAVAVLAAGLGWSVLL